MSPNKLSKKIWGKYIFLAFGLLIFIYVISWIPWLTLRGTNKITSEITSVEKHDVAIIFGGLHQTGGVLSETNRERLLAGVTLLKADKVDILLVSNTAEAAADMKTFLLSNGVHSDQIEIDTTAIVTEDTCVAERNTHPEGRSVIFVSHGYHLPRIIFTCGRLGVSGIGVPAEKVAAVEHQDLSALTVARIRFTRHQREATLSVLNILGLYGPTLEKEF